jgi:hypothetical protein
MNPASLEFGSRILHNPGSWRSTRIHKMARLPMIASRLLRQILTPPFLALALMVVLTDDAFRAFVIPAVRALARLALFRRIESAIAGMPPNGILLLFLIPLAIIEPFKIYALYLFSLGHFTGGVATFILAKVVGLGLAERLFAIGRDKLLSIRWFAWCHSKTLTVRDTVHAWLAKTKIWQATLRIVRLIRTMLARTRTTLARLLFRSGRNGRFAAARRHVRRYWIA